MNFKRIVYISHPISGNVKENIQSLLKIQRKINLDPKYVEIVAFSPYLSDVLCLNDEISAHREKWQQNGLYMLSKRAFINELWLFGNSISTFMQKEVYQSFATGIPVVAQSAILKPCLNTLATDYMLQFSQNVH
jgi:hypothetical protein